MNIRANAYYRLNGASAGTPSNPASELLAALAGSIQGVTGGKFGLQQVQSSGVLGPGITDLLQSQTDQYTGSTRPKAFLNWILLDEQFKIVNSSTGFEPVGADGEFKTFLKTGLPISQNGYLYVYTSNESPVDVFFDNLQVTHVRGPLLEETHYYPFGLTMPGISGNASSFGQPGNRRKYNGGSELQHQEFSDGSGLELYDTHFRQLDPQLGRWWQVDPKPNHAESPFASMGNNPILYNDVLGDTLPSGKNIYDKGGMEEFSALANPNFDGYDPNLVIHLSFSERLYLLGEQVLMFMMPTKVSVFAKEAQSLAPSLSATERGIQNEIKVLKDLNVSKNNKTFEVIDPLTKKPIKVIPDGITKSVIYEVKDTKRVSNTAQIRAERELAKQQGKKFQIVTGMNTKVSKNIPKSEIIRRNDLGPK
jgi:RHS repeat-associated protein